MHLLNKIIKILFTITIATLTLQFSQVAYQPEWGRGFINPYTTISFSITDLFLLATGVLFFIKIKFEHVTIKVGHRYFFNLLLAAFTILTASILISPFADTTFNFLLIIKLFSLLLFYLLIVNSAIRPTEILKIFTIAMSCQAVLAILQVAFQHSLGLYLVGEPHLSAETANIARFGIGSWEIIRGYGTFAHPNILGGFLIVSLLCSLLFSPQIKHEQAALMLIQFLGLLATFSRSSVVALAIAAILIGAWYVKQIKSMKNKIIPIAFSVFFLAEILFIAFSRGVNLLNDPAILERINGYKTAFQIFKEHPLGVGFQHYTLFMDKVSSTTLMPWEYQPVHNVFILLLTELGWVFSILICGLLLLAMWKFYQRRKKLLTHQSLFKKRILFVIAIALVVIGFFDHYLVTLEQGHLLVVMIFGIISAFSKDPRHVLPIKTGESLNKILADL